MSEVKTQCIIELNECWAVWLEKLYPNIHPALAMKSIIIERLSSYANEVKGRIEE